MDNPKFKNALFPCNYLLSILEGKLLSEKPQLPPSLDVKKAILLNNAVLDLSIRCIEHIETMLCDEMNIHLSQLRNKVSSDNGLRDQVFDLVVDAEKKSKKKILSDEGIDEADLIICSLLFKEDATFNTAMESIASKRMKKLAELGLNMLFVCLNNTL